MKKILLPTLFLIGLQANANGAELPGGCDDRTSGSHRLYGPDYVLKNASYRYELHTAFSYFGVSGRFHTDDSGFYAKDDIDISGRSHVGITFSGEPGSHDVWVQWGNFSPTSNCYSKSVVVQNNGPTAQFNSKSSGPVLYASVQNTMIDQYSKNSMEGDGRADIRFKFEHTDFTHTEYSNISKSESISYRPQYRGMYDIYAIISDGTFSKSLHLGTTLFTGAPNCQTCGPLN